MKGRKEWKADSQCFVIVKEVLSVTINKQYRWKSNIMMRTIMLLVDEDYVILVSQDVKN